eukprot:gb/GEZN01023918.1/.p1 GENE.gb/GEZN01023918.1/~~gb/GEZN01023918.1/.p1  ORF type:complete len:173 (-),score=3.48 gb/GEZN01023918.1/:63-551(-)
MFLLRRETGYGVYVLPVNGGRNGDVAIREGDVLCGDSSSTPLFMYRSNVVDSKEHKKLYQKLLKNPGSYVLKMGDQLFQVTPRIRKNLVDNIYPVNDAAGLINHSAEFDNITFVRKQGIEFPVAKATNNVLIGDQLLMNYGECFWARHEGGVAPRRLETFLR